MMRAESVRGPTVVCILAALLLFWPVASNASGPRLVPSVIPAGPGTITLYLWVDAYGACGDVIINGVVLSDDGYITALTWEWGDGIVHDSWFPAYHHYAANGSYTVKVTAYEDDGDSLTQTVTAEITNADDAGCEYTLRLHPAVFPLRDGVTTAPTWLELRDGSGNLVTTHGLDVTYASLNPALVQVDENGQVTGAGFGHAGLTVRIAGYPRSATASVVLGRFHVEPAIQLLSVNNNPTGPLALHAKNADNSALDLAGHTVTWSGGNDVASVDNSGVVTALSPPDAFGDSPYVVAQIDARESNNASFTRVTTSTLGIALHLWPGQLTAFWVPDEIGGFPFGQLMADLQAVAVTDHAYRLQAWLVGMSPAEGDLQYLVLDPGHDDGTVPCGLSGNPLRLGFNVDTGNNCFGGADWLHWGIFYHEMAHNFLNQPAFQSWLTGLTDPGDYIEGLATTLAMYVMDVMVKNPDDYGLDPDTVANLSRDSIHLTPANIRAHHFSALTTYEADPDYAADFTPDIMDAMMTRLHDEYGPTFIYRVLSAFVATDEWRALAFDNEDQRLTFWAAVCSAAAKDDLMARFRDSWGYPIDEAFYDRVFPLAERLVSRRDPAVDAGCDRTVPVGTTVTLDDAASFDWENDALTITWQVDVRPAGSTAAISDPTILHPTFQPDVMGLYTLSVGAEDDLMAGARDALALNACVLTAPSVSIGIIADIDVALSWQNAFAVYDVYEDAHDPYLTLATATLLGRASGTFTHTGALSPPYGSHYYIIRAQCGGEALSNRVGVFQYELVPGG